MPDFGKGVFCLSGALVLLLRLLRGEGPFGIQTGSPV